ncbi:MAG: DUF4097 family beta strand repeat-containing protein [Caldilineaceae bacterium]|nr:DUF4097 family beta strand repeat-containing protein [Caldilineaceae bacterium]
MDTNDRTEESASPSAGIVNCGSPSSLKAIGNLAFLVLAAVLTLTTAAACVLPASQKTEEVVDEFDISGPVNLTIDIFAGSVELVGVDGATNIQIAAEVHEPDRVKYKVAKKGNTVQVTAQQKRRGLGIRRDKLIGKVDLRVRMPTQANMEIRTNIGNIDARQLIGESELRTIAGNISVADSQGEFDLETEIGGISAHQIVGEFELRTTAGDISVADGQGEFTLETEIGGISARQIVGEFELRTTAGDISVADGRGEFDMETEIGGISAHQVVGEFELRTTAGDISVADGQGEFTLETEIGGISFSGEFTDQSDNLFSTVTGDIEVALVEEPNVELQASTHLAGKIHLGQSVSKSISEMGISGERRNLNMTMGIGTADLSLETQSGNVRIE